MSIRMHLAANICGHMHCLCNCDHEQPDACRPLQGADQITLEFAQGPQPWDEKVRVVVPWRAWELRIGCSKVFCFASSPCTSIALCAAFSNSRPRHLGWTPYYTRSNGQRHPHSLGKINNAARQLGDGRAFRRQGRASHWTRLLYGDKTNSSIRTIAT